jgi:hypothetical protein
MNQRQGEVGHQELLHDVDEREKHLYHHSELPAQSGWLHREQEHQIYKEL